MSGNGELLTTRKTHNLLSYIEDKISHPISDVTEANAPSLFHTRTLYDTNRASNFPAVSLFSVGDTTVGLPVDSFTYQKPSVALIFQEKEKLTDEGSLNHSRYDLNKGYLYHSGTYSGLVYSYYCNTDFNLLTRYGDKFEEEPPPIKKIL